VQVKVLFCTVLVVVVRETVKNWVRNPGKPEQQDEAKQNSTHYHKVNSYAQRV
jgi:hypothetical protein